MLGFPEPNIGGGRGGEEKCQHRVGGDVLVGVMEKVRERGKRNGRHHGKSQELSQGWSQTCAAFSRTVTDGDRTMSLPYLDGGHVLHTRCSLHRVEQTAVGNPLRYPADACGAVQL